MTTQLKQIVAAISGTEPKTKARNKALSSVRWVLREACGLYAGLDGARIVLVEKSSAQVFDGRDNEKIKIAFYAGVTGGKFTLETI